MWRAVGRRGLAALAAASPHVPAALPCPLRVACTRRVYSNLGAVWTQGYGLHTADAEFPGGPTLLVLQPRGRDAGARLEEARRLVESLRPAAHPPGAPPPPHLMVQSPGQHGAAKAATFFGAGTVLAVAAEISARNRGGLESPVVSPVDGVFVNAALSGIQQRNLEMAWTLPVHDRVGLILQIFGRRAMTREAKLQVALAELQFQASRLVRVTDASTGKRRGFGVRGETEVVSARGGKGGMTGAGESELELQRRKLAAERVKLGVQWAQVRRTRALHRAARRRRGGGATALIGLVGYTNAGKTSLLGALMRCGHGGHDPEEAHAPSGEDRLFATLDPTARRIPPLPSGRRAVVTDTVGFIRDLPVQLVESFRATLEEATAADLLLHVIDASAPDRDTQRAAVQAVLGQLGVTHGRLRHGVIEVWNKVDLLNADELESLPPGATAAEGDSSPAESVDAAHPSPGGQGGRRAVVEANQAGDDAAQCRDGELRPGRETEADEGGDEEPEDESEDDTGTEWVGPSSHHGRGRSRHLPPAAAVAPRRAVAVSAASGYGLESLRCAMDSALADLDRRRRAAAVRGHGNHGLEPDIYADGMELSPEEEAAAAAADAFDADLRHQLLTGGSPAAISSTATVDAVPGVTRGRKGRPRNERMPEAAA